jgi:predicted transcriptional regulator
MVAAIWIVRKDPDPTRPVINGLTTVIINADDAGSEATTIAEATASLVAQGHPLDSGYFDSADLALGAGQLDTDEDLIALGDPRIEVIA